MMAEVDDSQRFGERETFALELRLFDDPDPADQAPRDSVGSWGQWRLWVGGLNLCEHDLSIEPNEAIRCDAVTWYLAPLMRWLAQSWAPLLHEERLPEGGRASAAPNARSAYLESLSMLGDDHEQFEGWYAWASRHSIRRCAEGGLVPDVFMRRVDDEIEISWGDRLTPGGNAVSFAVEGGVSQQPVAAVATSLGAALEWFSQQPSLQKSPWMARLRDTIEQRKAATKPEKLLAWYLDRQDTPGLLTKLYKAARRQFSKGHDVIKLPGSGLFAGRFAPAVAMFGTVSPDMTERAGVRLMAAAIEAAEAHSGSLPIDEFVENLPAWQAGSPWANGYALAQDVVEAAGLVTSDNYVDIEGFLDNAGVKLRRVQFGRTGPRGVALAGEGFAPTIVVNRDHLSNSTQAGIRFTIAHEFCHILYDRGRARRISHSSTPWAPVPVEQRANAFAAMVLMPPGLVRRVLPAKVTLQTVADAADRMGVGMRSAIQHFANIGEISDTKRDALLAEFDAASAEKFRA
jgi:Zn-dependent peptidase ImmA (M78 family)